MWSGDIISCWRDDITSSSLFNWKLESTNSCYINYCFIPSCFSQVHLDYTNRRKNCLLRNVFKIRIRKSSMAFDSKSSR